MGCTTACWTEVHCTACGRPKAPRGRSVPLEVANSYCQRECPGHDQEPRAGHMWDEHDSDREWVDPDGWAAHVAACERCGED